MAEHLLAVLYFVVLFVLELVYFRIAFTYRIIDRPNERSSHKKITIRGGGIIFPLAVLAWFLTGFEFPLFLSGLILISVVSLIDDLNHINSKIRFFFQFLAVILMLFQLSFNFEWYWYPVMIGVVIGIMNAWNFMDGINGITGGYSLVTAASLYLINKYTHSFADSSFILIVIVSLVVFNYFNFRRKAKCFAGDVGSVSMAFIIGFLLIQLIASTQNMLFLGIILFYGLDTASTIIFRLMRGENIFEAHRSHFYQFLVNERRIPHLYVAAGYALLQVLVNIAIISLPNTSFVLSVLLFLAISISSLFFFILLRIRMEGKTAIVRRSGIN